MSEASVSKLPLFPTADPPEKESEENRAASVHAKRVAEFVSAPRVVRRVNGYVVAEQKIWKCAGHERALQGPAQETGGFRAPGNARRHVAHQKSHTHGHYQECGNAP